VIPLYGFLRGDTIGLVVLARRDDTIAAVAASLAQAAAVRVAPCADLRVVAGGRRLPPDWTVAQAGLGPLDRIDVEPEDAP
jgi:hypothetical protein